MAGRLGTIFVEMDIDRDRWAGAQRKLLKDATSTSLRIEDNFRKLGIKSSAEMDLMRRKITNSFNMIKNSSKATANDIVRAEKAKNTQLKRLNEQQFGHQTSLLKKLKNNWMATTAIMVASVYAIKRVVRVVNEFVDAASDLNETISKSNTIFLEHGQEMLDWAATAATSMGMSTQAALETAATLGNMFDQLGAGKKVAAGLSQEMVKLAVDIASFHNVAGGAEAVLTAMMSAFRGEYDALQRYIPTIKAATVAQEALAMTGKKTASQLTELEKAFAAQSIIIKGAGVAVGDFARTSGQLANQERILDANIKDLKASIGQALIPAVTDIVTEMNKWIAANKTFIDQKVPEVVDKTTTAILKLVDVYNALPEGVVGAAGVGIAGRIIFGGPAGGFLAIMYLINTQMEKLNLHIGSIFTKARELKDIIKTLIQGEGYIPSFTGEMPPTPDRLKLHIGTPGITPKAAPDMWESFGGGEETKDANWVASAYGFNQIEASTAEHFQRMKEMTDGNRTEIEALLASHIAEKLMLQEQFNEQYNALGKTQYDLERENIQTMAEAYRQAGADKVQVAELTAAKIKAIAIAENTARLESFQQAAGKISNTFLQIAQAGGKQSKKAFEIYKAFAMTEAVIGTALAITKTLGQLGWWGIPLAIAIGAMGAVQIAMIAKSQPPSYDQGGISQAKGVYQTGNISEAHIPLKSGKVPVKISGDGGEGKIFVIKMENPVFQDVDTQRQVFAQIAEVIARQVAPGAVVQNYNDDGQIRRMVRGRA